MAVSAAEKRRYRQIAHHLNPVLTIAGEGVSEGVLAEAERALNDHELIKVRFSLEERQDRNACIEHLAQETGAEVIQKIGKVAVLYRAALKPDPRLSNILRTPPQKP
jgi:RNA-binding protein